MRSMCVSVLSVLCGLVLRRFDLRVVDGNGMSWSTSIAVVGGNLLQSAANIGLALTPRKRLLEMVDLSLGPDQPCR